MQLELTFVSSILIFLTMVTNHLEHTSVTNGGRKDAWQLLNCPQKPATKTMYRCIYNQLFGAHRQSPTPPERRLTIAELLAKASHQDNVLLLYRIRCVWYTPRSETPLAIAEFLAKASRQDKVLLHCIYCCDRCVCYRWDAQPTTSVTTSSAENF